MSFQPIIALTNIPRDNSSFTVTDETPTGGASGWGSNNAPAGPGDITSLFAQFQAYGEAPIWALQVSGQVNTSMTFPATVQDGVNTFLAYYGQLATLTDFTISADGLTLTSNDPNVTNIFDGVKAISIDGMALPVPILSINGGTIKLSLPLPAGVVGTNLYKYYVAQIQALTVNMGESIAVNGISVMPVEADPNPNALDILQNVLLKLSAEIAFGCGNLSKAHEAARLISGNVPGINNNCNTCG